MGSFQFKLFHKAGNEDWTPTLKDIIDHYCSNENNKNISEEEFLLFESLFRQWGVVDENAKKFTRRILGKVVDDDRCRKLILANAEFYISVVNAAEADAADFKEKIEGMDTLNNDEELRDFAKAIGINLGEKSTE
ncbi:MAG: hypothetical protein CSA07_00680 [Bacteroidia bacterium]|nr:MAG: hypothetical protein CSA07_00680 [Bacteroidia bacterium]